MSARAYLPVWSTGVVLAAVPLVIGGSGYHMSLATTALVYVCYAIGFNVLFGMTGQLFLCVGALAGLSAYTTALLADRARWPLLAAVGAGTLLAAATGAVIGWVAERRRLDVILVGIVTLACSLVFTNVVQGTRGLTGGETGIVVAAGQGTLLRERVPAYLALVVLVTILLAVFRALESSRAGWAFAALRDDVTAAELSGVDVARHRIAAAATGSAMLGCAGAMFAAHAGFVSPSVFGFAHVDVRVVVMLAFGGVGTLLGPVVGAVAVAVLDELLRPLGQLRLAVYGAVLIVLFLTFRGGVVGFVRAHTTDATTAVRIRDGGHGRRHPRFRRLG